MQDRKLYEQLLAIHRPWRVRDVELQLDAGDVMVFVEHASGERLVCPTCGEVSPGYDTRQRRWRHLDTMQYRTVIVADVPRVRCATHGVVQCKVPWADEGSRLTALFEALVIDWLHEASVSAVARMLRLSWDEVAGVQRRAVRRGLARREFEPPRRIGVDETSFQKRHEYITVVNDLERQRVLHLADGRGRDVLDGFYAQVLGEAGCRRLEAVAMDMWAPYIRSTKAHVPDAEAKIVFDKFHIASHLGTAVDEVRRAENRELRREGDNRLVGTKYDWLRNPWNMNRSTWQSFAPLRTSQLRVARAWAIKETAMSLWGYLRRGWAERMWQRWYGWAIRSRLEPVKRVARMIRRHWYGVINAASTTTTNARAESINSKIQWVKRMANGYRNRENFRNAIYFHLGGLDLYPEALASTHTKA